MKMVHVSSLALAGALLLCLSANAATVSKNVDIDITHGAALTTGTYVNNSRATVPTGTPLLMAQAFRRGDVFLNSNCAIPRNASTHNPLIWQHDNTATRNKNGDDGSVRHWSFGTLTDAPVPPGGHYTIEWASTGIPCPPQTPHQTLTALASAHDLKLRFTNVVNQDLTMRGSGSLTFDINAAAASTGRDAPSKYATGPVYDGWRIVGPPTWDAASSGRLIGAMLSSAQITLSNWTGITNGSFHVTVDGSPHDVTGINLSAVTGMSDVAAAINARLTAAGAGATMSFDPNDQVRRFQLFSNSTGTSSAVSFLTAAAGGTDISGQLLMTSGATSSNSQVNAYTQAGLAAGSKDPLLYVVCYVDVTTQADGSTIGKVRTSCGIHNSWMNVAAGSAGNPGAPGAAGYANDPQFLVYRPALMDGSHALIDWGAMFDYSVSSTGSFIASPAGGCESGVPTCWNIAASAGDTPWTMGGTHVYTCSPQGACTPPTAEILIGFTGADAGPSNYVAGHYYGDVPSGYRSGQGENFVSFYDALVKPQNFAFGAYVVPTSQGSGTHNFSYRLTHFKFESWYTFTPEGFAPWSDGTSVSISPFDVALDQGSFGGERLYWEETGVVIPIRLTGQAPSLEPYGVSSYGSAFYMPMGRGNLIGGGGTGERPELDILNEYAGACWYTMSPSDCENMRSLTFSSGIYPVATLLNEITGHIPASNNGPPTGPDGTGAGAPYPILGAPWPTLILENFAANGNVVPSLDQAPVERGWGVGGANSTTYPYGSGFWISGGPYQQDHEPEFAGLTYHLYGNPQFLDMIYMHAQRDMNNHGRGYTNPTTGVTYYNAFVGTEQVRGGHWIFRDVGLCAALGDDTRPERPYCNDVINESGRGWSSKLSAIDGSAAGAYEHSINEPGYFLFGSAFVQVFGTMAGYQGWTMLRAPLGKQFLDQNARLLLAICGHSIADWPAYPPAYACTTYLPQYAIKDGSIGTGAQNSGLAYNVVDGKNFADSSIGANFTAGSGQVRFSGFSNSSINIMVGDTVLNDNASYGGQNIDQLNPTFQYTIIGPIDNNSKTFYVRCEAADNARDPTHCPVAGQAFTGFTLGGAPYTDQSGGYALEWHAQFDDGTFVNANYVPYKWQAISALSTTGYNMSPAINQLNTRYGTITKNNGPSYILDPTVVVR